MSFPEDKKVNAPQDGMQQNTEPMHTNVPQQQQNQQPQYQQPMQQQPQHQQPMQQQPQYQQQMQQQPQYQQPMQQQPQMQQPGMPVENSPILNTAINVQNKRRGILITVLVLIAVLIAGAVGGYFYYKRTPTYSLKVIGEAFENRDTRTIEERIELNQVFTDFFIGAARGEIKKEFVNPSEALVSKYLASVQDKMNQTVKETTDDFLKEIKNSKHSKDKADGKSKGNSRVSKDKMESEVFFDNFTYEKVESVETNGKEAKATILFKVKEPNVEVPLVFRMEQDSDGMWTITNLENGEEVWKIINDGMQRELDAANAKAKAEIDRYVTIGALKGSVTRSYGRNQPYIYFYMPVTTHEKAVRDIDGVITISGVGDEKQIIRLNASWHSTANKVGNNGAWGFIYYLRAYDNNDYLLSQTDLSKVEMSFEPRSITFFDGTSITLKDSLDD